MTLSIEQVKVVLGGVTRDAEDVIAEIQGMCDRLDEATVRLRDTASGSSHQKADEAIRYLQQARDRLEEAGILARGAVGAAGVYRSLI
ncbi:MAG: hypothetical protein H0T78_05290 [Longispora sp.]|nr:hypothetical protein [Longispora sp. (in: high G+C Gram-positive bacteria)]